MGAGGRWTATLIVALVFFVQAWTAFPVETASLAELEKKIGEGATGVDLATYAYRTNPSIKEARAAWKAVIERHGVATAYPDPQFLFTYFPRPIETRLGPQDWTLNLVQPFPFPGKLSKAGEIVEADVRIARLNLDKMVRDVIVKIRESYHELLYIEEAKRVVAQNRDLLNHLRKVGETAYAQNRTAFIDVVKAQSQSAQLQYDGLLLEELEQTEKAQLNSLLNRAPGAEIKLASGEALHPVVYNLEEIYQLASRNQEEIQMAQTQVEKARAKVDLAWFDNLPEFRLGLFYAGIGHPDVAVQPQGAGRDAVGVQFGLSIPLWWGKDAGRVGEARAEEERARSGKNAQVNNTFAQVRSLYFRLLNSERLVRLYRDELLPQAASSMEVAETWFREKQGSFSDFVETEAVYYNFQLALARAKADYGKYLARLEQLVGRSLSQKGTPGDSKAPGKGAT